MKVTKAIVLAGGYGTRRLPLTKAIDKCMLPVGNRPIIDYVIDDCVKAGVTDIYIALSQLGDQIRTYYGRNVVFKRYLEERGKAADLATLRNLPKARLHFFDGSHWPDEPQGTAMPIPRFLEHYKLADDEQVIVVGADDFIYKPHGGSAIKQLLDAMAPNGRTAGMLSIEVPRDQTYQYGVLEVKGDNFVRVVEKPNVEDAPSNLVNISKYVFDKQILEHITWITKNTDRISGEARLTDALNMYVRSGNKLHVTVAKGEYLDGGTLEGWLHANNRVSTGK